MQLGAGRLTREFLSGDPYTEKSISKLKSQIKERLEEVEDVFHKPVQRYAYATSKTFRTLRRLQIHYLPEFGENLSLEGLNLILEKLKLMTQRERTNLPGITGNRAKQIVAGALVAQLTMKKLDLDFVITCPWALREGVVLHRLDWLK